MAFTTQAVCVFTAMLPTTSNEDSDGSQSSSALATPRSSESPRSKIKKTLFGGMIKVKNTFIDVDDVDNSVLLPKRSHSLGLRHMTAPVAHVESVRMKNAARRRLSTQSTACSEGPHASEIFSAISTPRSLGMPEDTVSASTRTMTMFGGNGTVKNTFIHISDVDNSALLRKRSVSMPDLPYMNPRVSAAKSTEASLAPALSSEMRRVCLWQPCASGAASTTDEDAISSTCEGDDTDGASSVGSPCCDAMSHIDTETESNYGPSYVPQPSVVDVMNNTLFALTPCGFQFVPPPSVATPPCWDTALPSMRAEAIAACSQTSVLLHNLPDGFTRSMLMSVLRDHGLAHHVNFVYLPADFNNKITYGYATVNLSTPEAAESCVNKLSGFSDWGMPCDKACEASWCTVQEGLHALIERYRNSRVMHETVDDEYKPALFNSGVRIRFPLPTKSVRAPRLRKEVDSHPPLKKPLRASRPHKEEDSETLLALWGIA